jgi:hypothetical protein
LNQSTGTGAPAGPGEDRNSEGLAQTGDHGDVTAEHVTIRQGGANNVRATTVTIEQGGTARVQATELTVSQGGVALARAERLSLRDASSAVAVIAGEAHFSEGSNVVFLLARHVDGNVRPLLDWRSAAAIGAGLGLVLAILRRR